MCQLASGPVCVGHRLLDQHFAQRDREREKTLLSGFSGPHGAGRGYEQEPLPIVLSLSLFPFPSFNCVRFSLAPGYSQSFFRAHSSSSPIRPPAVPRRRPYPTSEFLPAWNQKLRQLFFLKIQLRAAAESASFTSACQITAPGARIKQTRQADGIRPTST